MNIEERIKVFMKRLREESAKAIERRNAWIFGDIQYHAQQAFSFGIGTAKNLARYWLFPRKGREIKGESSENVNLS